LVPPNLPQRVATDFALPTLLQATGAQLALNFCHGYDFSLSTGNESNKASLALLVGGLALAGRGILWTIRLVCWPSDVNAYWRWMKRTLYNRQSFPLVAVLEQENNVIKDNVKLPTTRQDNNACVTLLETDLHQFHCAKQSHEMSLKGVMGPPTIQDSGSCRRKVGKKLFLDYNDCNICFIP